MSSERTLKIEAWILHKQYIRNGWNVYLLNSEKVFLVFFQEAKRGYSHKGMQTELFSQVDCDLNLSHQKKFYYLQEVRLKKEAYFIAHHSGLFFLMSLFSELIIQNYSLSEELSEVYHLYTDIFYFLESYKPNLSTICLKKIFILIIWYWIQIHKLFWECQYCMACHNFLLGDGQTLCYHVSSHQFFCSQCQKKRTWDAWISLSYSYFQFLKSCPYQKISFTQAYALHLEKSNLESGFSFFLHLLPHVSPYPLKTFPIFKKYWQSSSIAR